MQTEFIINNTGAYISPTSLDLPVRDQFGYSGFRCQLTFEFYNAIINDDGIIIVDETSLVTSGVSGNLIISARGSKKSNFTAIENSPANLATTYNVQVAGVIQSFQFSGTITGCNYIRVLYYRGA